jgi:hypothetical protein
MMIKVTVATALLFLCGSIIAFADELSDFSNCVVDATHSAEKYRPTIPEFNRIMDGGCMDEERALLKRKVMEPNPDLPEMQELNERVHKRDVQFIAEERASSSKYYAEWLAIVNRR